MKINILFTFGSLIFLGILSSGFVRPSLETTIKENKEISFADFLSYFKKAELPYQMGVTDFKKYENFKHKTKGSLTKKTKTNLTPSLPFNKFIPEITMGKFSRMGSPKIQPLIYFHPSDKSVAVIYSTISRFSDDIYESFAMVVFDLEGSIIFPVSGKKIKHKKKQKRHFQTQTSFALGHSSIKNTIAFEINKKGQIWKKTYKNIWKKDLKKTSFLDNQLLGFEIEDTEVFQLDEKGLVVKLKNIPTQARANLD